MEYRFGKNDRATLTARKLWACHADVVVALIADLNAPDLDQPVRTALDQCTLRGAVTVADRKGTPRILPEGEYRNLSVRWLHHGGFAFSPLNGIPLSVHIGPATGSWASVGRSLSPRPVTARTFLPILEHGKRPSLQNSGFVIVSSTATKAPKLLKNPCWHVLRNEASVQAVQFSDGMLMACFYEPGEIAAAGRRLVAVGAPCLVMLEPGTADPERLHPSGRLGLCPTGRAANHADEFARRRRPDHNPSSVGKRRARTAETIRKACSGAAGNFAAISESSRTAKALTAVE
jgi:hypothetical protein